MELYLPPEIAIRKQEYDPKTGRFLKGHRAWNKGLKGITIGGEQTQFKPGHEPHNTKYDGAISIRKDSKQDIYYKYIRVAKGKWELLHRYIWKQHNGEIPKGMLVVFKDGNQMNCSIDNLELITRKENMQRNRNYKKAKKSLAETWKRDKLRVQYGLKPKTKWFKRKLDKAL